jgi:hypothetical protein
MKQHPVNLSEPIALKLYWALFRVMRAGSNGHPFGHDAFISGQRALKEALGGVEPDLRCNCTPCALARLQSAAVEPPAAPSDQSAINPDRSTKRKAGA